MSYAFKTIASSQAQIAAISPTMGSGSGGTLVTITGRNFPTNPNVELIFYGADGSVLSTQQATVTYSASRLIEVTTPANPTSSFNNAEIRVYKNNASDEARDWYFYYYN